MRPGSLRLAGAPISWGVCEVPGWGAMLTPDRVFAEMASLGLEATELGPLDDYLPLDGARIRAALDVHGLRAVGGFVPLELAAADVAGELERAAAVAGQMAAAGADTFVLALVADAAWSPPPALDDAAAQQLAANVDAAAAVVAEQGMRLVVHPHHGTYAERADDVERLVQATSAGWCLDTGHLSMGGYDPLAFLRRHRDRVRHVHLKDMDAAIAARLAAGELTLMQATQAGLFRPLGQGDAGVAAVVSELVRGGYDGWAVLEQDLAITGAEPAPGTGPVDDVRASLRFLDELEPVAA